MLEKALYWISKGDITGYMADHQHDPNANELWIYFRNIIEWVQLTFTTYRKEMKGIDWGRLYDAFHDVMYDTDKSEQEIAELMMNDDVSNKKQHGIYAKCGKHFDIKQMEGDHITPWHAGDKTNAENCQMLCVDCNRRKSGI